MEKNKKNLSINVKKLNEMFNIGSKVLKLLYFILAILIIYIVSLVFKEWRILKFILNIISVISPLFYGILIAWLLNPFVTKLNNKGMSRTFSTIIVYFTLIVLVYLFSLALIPSLVDQVNDVVSSIPTILTDLKEWVNNLFIKISDESLMDLNNVKKELFTSIEVFGQDLTTNLPKMAIGFIQSLVSGIGTIVVSFIVGFYMLFNFPNIKQHFLNILPKRFKKDTNKLINSMSDTLLAYIKGTLSISFILFLVNYIGFLIIGLKAPALFALFCAITNLIPYVGPYIGGAVAAVVGFTQSTFIGIVIIVFIVICQALESYVLQPVVMSKKTNLHPVTILVGLLVFGSFFGIFGMIIATPIIALLKVIYVFLDEKYGFFDHKE